MKIEKELVVDGSPEEIWDFLWRVDEVAACIRGTSDVRTIEDRKRYSAVVTQRVGPFGVSFPLAIDVVDAEAPSSLTVAASGRDTRLGSGLKATMRLTLRPADEGRSVLTIDTDLGLQGKLASLGQGIIGRKADEELEHFSRALAAQLRAEDEARG